jgi:hypothetical protein
MNDLNRYSKTANRVRAPILKDAKRKERAFATSGRQFHAIAFALASSPYRAGPITIAVLATSIPSECQGHRKTSDAAHRPSLRPRKDLRSTNPRPRGGLFRRPARRRCSVLSPRAGQRRSSLSIHIFSVRFREIEVLTGGNHAEVSNPSSCLSQKPRVTLLDSSIEWQCHFIDVINAPAGDTKVEPDFLDAWELAQPSNLLGLDF